MSQKTKKKQMKELKKQKKKLKKQLKIYPNNRDYPENRVIIMGKG